VDTIDDILTRLAIRHGLVEYGMFFETVDTYDDARIAELERAGAAVADELGVQATVVARPRADAGVQVRVMVVRTPVQPAPAA
jgi:hypothetical protein